MNPFTSFVLEKVENYEGYYPHTHSCFVHLRIGRKERMQRRIKIRNGELRIGYYTFRSLSPPHNYSSDLDSECDPHGAGAMHTSEDEARVNETGEREVHETTSPPLYRSPGFVHDSG